MPGDRLLCRRRAVTMPVMIVVPSKTRDRCRAGNCLRRVEQRRGGCRDEVAVVRSGTASRSGKSGCRSSIRILVRMKIVKIRAPQHHQNDEWRHQREFDGRQAAAPSTERSVIRWERSLSTVTVTRDQVQIASDRRSDRRQVGLRRCEGVADDWAQYLDRVVSASATGRRRSSQSWSR